MFETKYVSSTKIVLIFTDDGCVNWEPLFSDKMQLFRSV